MVKKATPAKATPAKNGTTAKKAESEDDDDSGEKLLLTMPLVIAWLIFSNLTGVELLCDNEVTYGGR